MARKKKHEEHENHERWLVSYADFITLLFAFFVVMYSVSAINEGKFRILSEALEAAFRATPKSMEPVQMGYPSKPEMLENRTLNRSPQAVPSDKPIQLMPRPGASPGATEAQHAAILGQALSEIAQKIEQSMAALIREDLVHVRRFEFWVEVEIKTNILFPSGSAELEPGARPTLHRIAEILREYPNRIHIEGFTDNVPIRTSAYPSNWELSAARSASVVHLFVKEGIKPERMAVVGYGEFKPVAPNDDEGGRQRNRKVVLVVLAENAPHHVRELMRDAQPADTRSSLDPALVPPSPASAASPVVPAVSGAAAPASPSAVVAPPAPISLPGDRLAPNLLPGKKNGSS